MKITNEDNMKLMARYPDNYFDLGFIDPEYGINASNPSKKPCKVKQKNGKFLNVKSNIHTNKDWDKKPAGKTFGRELNRVCRDLCVFGGNYFDWIVKETFKPPRRSEFDNFLKQHPKGWILWDKLNGNSDQMDCELLWSSFNFDSFIIPHMWSGMIQGSFGDGTIQEGNKSKNEKRIHPTQKTIRIYEKILIYLVNNKFITQSDNILDTNYGSGSLGIACFNLGFKLTACELEKDYFDSAIKRLKIHQMQQTLF